MDKLYTNNIVRPVNAKLSKPGSCVHVCSKNLEPKPGDFKISKKLWEAKGYF